MRVEPLDHLLRVPGEVVVAIPAAGRAFDPEQLLVLFVLRSLMHPVRLLIEDRRVVPCGVVRRQFDA
jgi:hypothetical protein